MAALASTSRMTGSSTSQTPLKMEDISFRVELKKGKIVQIVVIATHRVRKKRHGKTFTRETLMGECGFPSSVDMNKIHETLEKALVSSKNDKMNVVVTQGGHHEGFKGSPLIVTITHDLGFFVLTYRLSLDEIAHNEMNQMQASIADLEAKVDRLSQENDHLKRQMNEQSMAVASLSRKVSILEQDRKENDALAIKRISEVIYVASRARSHKGSFTHGEGLKFEIDALTLTVDRDVCLTGIGMLFGKGLNSFKVNLYEGHNSHGVKPVYKGPAVRFEWANKNKKPVKHDLGPNGITLRHHQLYTIEIHQTGPPSFHFAKYEPIIIVHGVTFRFGKAKQSPNGTSPTSGMIPCLFFQK